jgi:hypothetical protein
MDEAFDLILLQPDGLNGFEHRIDRRMRTRRNLGDPSFGAVTPDGNDVRERAPDIDSDFPFPVQAVHFIPCSAIAFVLSAPNKAGSDDRSHATTCGSNRESRAGDETSRYSRRGSAPSRRRIQRGRLERRVLNALLANTEGTARAGIIGLEVFTDKRSRGRVLLRNKKTWAAK